MQCFDIVGRVGDGFVVCANCATEEEMNEETGLMPIFANCEFDSYPCCERCWEIIEDVELTEFGIDEMNTSDKLAMNVSQLRHSFFDPYLETNHRVEIKDVEYTGFSTVELLKSQDYNLYDLLFSQWLEQEVQEGVIYRDRNGDFWANLTLLKERNR